MTKDLGTESNERAAVDEIMFFSFISTPGNEVGFEPVAITIFWYYKMFFSIIIYYDIRW